MMTRRFRWAVAVVAVSAIALTNWLASRATSTPPEPEGTLPEQPPPRPALAEKETTAIIIPNFEAKVWIRFLFHRRQGHEKTLDLLWTLGNRYQNQVGYFGFVEMRNPAEIQAAKRMKIWSARDYVAVERVGEGGKTVRFTGQGGRDYSLAEIERTVAKFVEKTTGRRRADTGEEEESSARARGQPARSAP